MVTFIPFFETFIINSTKWEHKIIQGETQSKLTILLLLHNKSIHNKYSFHLNNKGVFIDIFEYFRTFK